jgi:hypothetical protein
LVTKLDGTARGGSLLGIASALKIPIRWVGMGERIDQLVPFSKQEYVDGLFENALAQGSRFLLGCLVFFFGGCTDDIPVVSENFVNAYVELRVVSREYGETSPDSRIARTEVLKKYGYTKESFDSAAMNIKQNLICGAHFKKK